jgi:hypothetical protein
VGCFLSFIMQKQAPHGTQSMGFEDCPQTKYTQAHLFLLSGGCKSAGARPVTFSYSFF